MTEFTAAADWRIRRGLTQGKLAERIGYARETIYWMERGQTPQGRTGPKPGRIKPRVWLRYKMACAGLEAQLKGNRRFEW